MRTVHLVMPGPGDVLRPLCGDWGSMETDWTGEPDEATCRACREAYRSGLATQGWAPVRPR
jgi:hypothetical protein